MNGLFFIIFPYVIIPTVTHSIIFQRAKNHQPLAARVGVRSHHGVRDAVGLDVPTADILTFSNTTLRS